MFMYGHGVPKDAEEATEWYRRSADQGEPIGKYNLAICYELGNGVAIDTVRARQLYESAFHGFLDKARQDNATSQFYVGLMYYFGKGVNCDYEQAAEWMTMAANNNHPDAWDYLGYAYWFGVGVSADYSEADKWYRKAAETGDAESQYHYGNFLQGDSIMTNDEEGAMWVRKAAEQGHMYAQETLGRLYQLGTGVKADYNEAVKWYRKAAQQGDSTAIMQLNYLGETY